MKLVGLTGGIGAGKSEALAALGRLGAATISTDAVVHELLGGDELRELLVERWGEGVAPGGEVDRNRVGALVFERPGELAWLESTLHPLVGERIAAWREQLPAGTRLGVVEVPLLFETGMEGIFDATLCVLADEGVRLERAVARGHAGLEGRSGRQLDPEEKARRADYVVRNDGTPADLEASLAELVETLLGGLLAGEGAGAGEAG